MDKGMIDVELRLPSPEEIERKSAALAVLEAVLCPEPWDFRTYSYNGVWNTTKRERLASMKNGSGDEYVILFSPAGAVIKGLDHECPLSHYNPLAIRLFDGLPSKLEGFLRQPAFNLPDTTFFFWHEGSGWGRSPKTLSPEPGNGAEWLLDIYLGDTLQKYYDYALECYECHHCNLQMFSRVFEHEPMSEALLAQLNPNITMSDVMKDFGEIGYPVRVR